MVNIKSTHPPLPIYDTLVTGMGMGRPAPRFRAMPESKRSFSYAISVLRGGADGSAEARSQTGEPANLPDLPGCAPALMTDNQLVHQVESRTCASVVAGRKNCNDFPPPSLLQKLPPSSQLLLSPLTVPARFSKLNSKSSLVPLS